MDSYQLEIKEGRDGGEKVEDPLDLVFHDDGNSYDCPEDWMCCRAMNSWISEVNRLRQLLADNGLDPSEGID